MKYHPKYHPYLSFKETEDIKEIIAGTIDKMLYDAMKSPYGIEGKMPFFPDMIAEKILEVMLTFEYTLIHKNDM